MASFGTRVLFIVFLYNRNQRPPNRPEQEALQQGVDLAEDPSEDLSP